MKALSESQPRENSGPTMRAIPKKGIYTILNLAAYVKNLMTYIAPKNIIPLKLVVNSGNGAARHVVD